MRIQDIDAERLQLTVRNGKGAKDRYTILPECEVAHIEHQFDVVRAIYENDRKEGRNGVSLPQAIDRRFKGAPNVWKWQYLFPSSRYAFITRIVGACAGTND